jgi:hypothetical protein
MRREKAACPANLARQILPVAAAAQHRRPGSLAKIVGFVALVAERKGGAAVA